MLFTRLNQIPAALATALATNNDDTTSPSSRMTQDNVRLILGDEAQQSGVLHVSEQNVVWWCASANQGVAIEYINIMIHAISRDPEPCIYCQLADPSDDCDDETPTELRFVPEDSSSVEALYAVLSECQALQPEEEDNSGAALAQMMFGGFEDGGISGMPQQLTAEGQATADRLANMLSAQMLSDGPTQNGIEDEDVEDGQFDDAV